MSLANSYVFEESITGETIISFPWPARDVQVTNDSGTTNVQYKLNASEVYRTLHPYETSRLENVRMPELYIKSTGAPVRVWGLG